MKSCTRRDLLKTSLIATALASLPQAALAASRPPLVIPPLMESRRGRPILLTMQETQTALLEKKTVEVWGFNGHYLGPTVKVKQGDYVKLMYHNNLPHAVSVTIQGLQTSGESLGGVMQALNPKQSWAPVVQVTQTTSTCWYRSDTLMHSAYQTYRGLVGMWIVEDNETRKSNLPSKYGVDDIPLILQDMTLNSSGTQLFQANQPQFLGERLFVNGQESPYLTVPRGWVRLRILNASLSRTYPLHFDDDREFLLIGRGTGFLPQSKSVKSIFLSPGERAEIVVNLNEGDNISLISGAKRSFFDKVGAFFSADNELHDNTVLELRPEGLPSAFDSQKNYRFVAAERPTQPIVQERKFHLDTKSFMINQRRFDPRRIDVSAKLDSLERWTLTANEATGFYMQGAKFIVESVDGQPVDDSDISWQDTVWISGETKILVKFEHTSSNNYPFSFGAANLLLADKGCQGLIIVQ
ncbi:cell division protein SufI [Cricetibacter osteomyelitidis]|uniref:Cell division protein FtsP n=1 Tax=Cricetibacter osteomyelitidis TaxID=1521931 RepID=A0A4R2T260_9PAST|nr:multicopper oxidase domain-containing protein [Cricetibacter osteomyelitidis]TCP96045.1 cell division protein SufI [Cricetibacter osteomyelitidis]